MKQLKFSILLLIVMSSDYITAQLPPDNPNYELVFEDNFEEILIDASKWKSIWDWNQSGSINVAYCNNIPSGWIGPDLYGYRKRNFENCTISGDTLKIISKKEDYSGWVWNWPLCTADSCNQGTGYHPCQTSHTPPICWDEDLLKFNYTTSMLISKETFKYGYFEIRCKLPKPAPPKTNKGIGPNFWLWSGAGPTVTWSEIDIFEFNGENTTFGSSIHYEDVYGNISHGIPNNVPPIYVDFYTFHTFSALWTPQKIDFFLDGNLYISTNIHVEDLLDMPLIIDVNFPLHTMCQLLDSVNTQLPHNYEIDYVRVYQLKSNCNTDYSICSYNNINYAHYKTISIGGNGCNVVVPSGQKLNLISSEGITIISNFTIEEGGEFSLEILPCFQSIHTFPSTTKSELYPQQAPESFYKRLNPIYHE
jgi:hypothetical protein